MYIKLRVNGRINFHRRAQVEPGYAKLGNAPPRNHRFGPPKIFFLDGDAKELVSKWRCQARGVWGHAPPPENFAEFDLILEAFCVFEPLKFLSFNKV